MILFNMRKRGKMINKDTTRKRIRTKLSNLSTQEIGVASKFVIDKCKQLEPLRNANIVAVFSSIEKEIQTRGLLEFLLDNNKRVVMPCIENDEMVMREINKLSFECIESYKNIKQPSRSHKVVDPQEIDLIFVPCLGFDSQLNRLGRGKGFYDKYLKKTSAKKVLLALEVQKVEELEVETHDVAMDIIVTDLK